LVRKNTTNVRQIAVSIITPDLRNINSPIMFPVGQEIGRPMCWTVFASGTVCLHLGPLVTAPVTGRSLFLTTPLGRIAPLIVVVLKRNMHFGANKALFHVVIDRAPIWLDGDALVLDQRLHLGRDLATLIGIG
jgi:hypothetical protein